MQKHIFILSKKRDVEDQWLMSFLIQTQGWKILLDQWKIDISQTLIRTLIHCIVLQ